MADLSGLIRVAQSTVDDRRRALAGFLRRAEDLNEARTALDRELEQERTAARDGGGHTAAWFGPYVALAMARRRGIDEALAAVEGEITTARSTLGEAFRELRALELTEEARERRRAEAAARRERDILDEIGMQRHRRLRAVTAA